MKAEGWQVLDLDLLWFTPNLRDPITLLQLNQNKNLMSLITLKNPGQIKSLDDCRGRTALKPLTGNQCQWLWSEETDSRWTKKAFLCPNIINYHSWAMLGLKGFEQLYIHKKHLTYPMSLLLSPKLFYKSISNAGCLWASVPYLWAVPHL